MDVVGVVVVLWVVEGFPLGGLWSLEQGCMFCEMVGWGLVYLINTSIISLTVVVLNLTMILEIVWFHCDLKVSLNFKFST